MYKKLGFIKKIRLFSSYRKSVKSIKNILDQDFNIRIDSAHRMYTVINIPEDIIGEAYSIKKSDIDRISENYIKEYSSELSKFLNKNGLSELFEFYEIKKVDKYSYLVVIGFSLFRSHEYYNTLYWRYIPISSLIILSLFILFIIG
jgi:hypothetical protein